MVARVALIFVASFLATAPAMAQSLDGAAAQPLVTGKDFAFSCFDGSRGLGRIENDGSVIATIQVSGAGPMRPIRLPPGTLKVQGDAVCASLQTSKSEQCFNLNKTGEQSFRASLPGLSGIAYCDFVRQMTVGLKQE